MNLMIKWCHVAAVIHSVFISSGILVIKSNTDPPPANAS